MEQDIPEVEHATYKKIFILIAIVGVVIFFVSIGIFFVGNTVKNPTMKSEKSTQEKSKSEEDTSVENSATLTQTQFMFAKIDTATNKTEMYRRPVGKDASDKIIEIPGVFEPGKYTRLGQNIAFVIATGIYTSSDGGQSFKKIYSAPTSEDITSIRFSKHKAQLAVAVTNAYGTNRNTSAGNIVYTMNSDGSSLKELFSLSDVGIFIRDWSIESGNVLYQAGCNRCDQASRVTAIYSIKKKNHTPLPAQDADAIGNLALNDAGSQVLYSLALHVDSVRITGSIKEGYYGPPYTIHKYDIAKKQDRTIIRMGKRVSHPVTIADIPLQPSIATAGTSYGRQHYYLYDNKITLLFDDNSTKELLTMPANLSELLFVSDGQVLAIMKKGDGWNLVTFDPKSQSQQVLFAADATMIPLGMSDQF